MWATTSCGVSFRVCVSGGEGSGVGAGTAAAAGHTNISFGGNLRSLFFVVVCVDEVHVADLEMASQ